MGRYATRRDGRDASVVPLLAVVAAGGDQVRRAARGVVHAAEEAAADLQPSHGVAVRPRPVRRCQLPRRAEPVLSSRFQVQAVDV